MKINNNYNKLDKDIDYILSNCKIKSIHVCCYKIVEETCCPFILYLFFLNRKNGESQFYLTKINIENLGYEGEKIIDLLKNGILNEIKKNDKDIDCIKDNILFKGLELHNNEAYIFFDINSLYIKYNINAEYRFIMINEILNGISYIYSIDEVNVDFFTANSHYGLLYDSNWKQYETPIAGYLGINQKELYYNFYVGIEREKNIFGTCYYFTNYENASNNSQYVIKAAIFLGRLCIKENFPYDKYDENAILRKNENLISRITDYNELWKKNYDSVYVGKIELDNGEEFAKGPLYALTKCEQFLQISYELVVV